MAKAIATGALGAHEAFLEHTLPLMRCYAQRHGYDLIQGAMDGPDHIPAAWRKVRLARRLLDAYEAVLWIDADVVILDHGKDIASEVSDCAVQAMALHRKPHARCPNSGVWFMRPALRGTLDYLWEHRAGRWPNEQGSLMALMGYRFPQPRKGRKRLVGKRARHQKRTWLYERTDFLPSCWNHTRRSDDTRFLHVLGGTDHRRWKVRRFRNRLRRIQRAANNVRLT